MAKTRVDQQAVADALSISRTVVTKVLNHDPVFRVASETRQAILVKARELGYVPRRRRIGNIAFVACGVMSSFLEELYHTIALEAARTEQRVFFVNPLRYPTYDEVKRLVNPLSADGVVVAGAFADDLINDMKTIMPVMAVCDQPVDCDVDCVYTDDESLSHKLTNHVAKLGHKQIALITHTAANRSIVNGYRRAIEEAGLTFIPSLVAEKARCPYPELLSRLFHGDPKPTAIVACTTADNAEIVSSLTCMGLRIPDDVSYIAYACPPGSRAWHSLNVVCLEDFYPSIARTAVRRLLDRIENPDAPIEKIQAEARIRPGSSVKPPAD